MKFLNTLTIIALTAFLATSCKEANSNSELEKKASTSISKNTIATKPETASFKIDGMSCAVGCAKTIEKNLSKTTGVQNAKVDFEKKEAIVTFDAAVISGSKIQEIVEKAADGKTYKVSELKVKA